MKLSVFLLCAAILFAQDDVVFRSGVSLVRVDAEAVDTNGRVVSGLTKDDFRVFDEDAPQPLVNFSFDVEPLDLILLFDTSGSMHNKLLNIVRAAELGFDELHKTDRICVRSFNAESTEAQAFTSDLQMVNEAILLRVLTLRFGGQSSLEPAADAAALRLRKEPTTHRKRAILIITDKRGGRGLADKSIVRDLWSSDAVLSELILDRAGPTKLLEKGANGLVDETGGATIVAGVPGDAFRDSVHYVRSGYAMYYALPDASPGSERRLRVELTPEAARRLPNVRVRARSGYIVQPPAN
ncbi:MAG: VWA domain-containing protein [Acidobacteriota bacterium]|nr:VWA domain-containing protein [Acidobacteriota bacterium]